VSPTSIEWRDETDSPRNSISSHKRFPCSSWNSIALHFFVVELEARAYDALKAFQAFEFLSVFTPVLRSLARLLFRFSELRTLYALQQPQIYLVVASECQSPGQLCWLGEIFHFLLALYRRTATWYNLGEHKYVAEDKQQHTASVCRDCELGSVHWLQWDCGKRP